MKIKLTKNHYRSILKKYLIPSSFISRYNIYFKFSSRFYRKSKPLHHGSFWYYLTQEQWDHFIDSLLLPLKDSLEKAENIFEVGMGCGAALKRVSESFPHLNLNRIDPEKKAIKLAKKHLSNGRYLTGNGMFMDNIPDNSYDIVISHCVIIYLKNMDQVFQFCNEIIRIAKPGAKIMITCMVDENGKHLGTGNIKIPKYWWAKTLDNVDIEDIVTIGDIKGCEHQKDRYVVYMSKNIKQTYKKVI